MPPLVITADNAKAQIEQQRLRLQEGDAEGDVGCYQDDVPLRSLAGTIPCSRLYRTIPRDEWKDRIREQKGADLHTITKDVLPPHDQGSTNYCWAHGSVRALEIQRVYQGMNPEILSAESVAVPLTGGRNRGGTPTEALKQLRQYGACLQTYWPKNDRNINHAKPGWKDNRLYYQILRWVIPHSWEEQITLALHNIAIAVGLNWWGHLIVQKRAVILPDGSVGTGCDNSWGPSYGDNGYFELDESHGTATLGAFGPISATFPGP